MDSTKLLTDFKKPAIPRNFVHTKLKSIALIYHNGTITALNNHIHCTFRISQTQHPFIIVATRYKSIKPRIRIMFNLQNTFEGDIFVDIILPNKAKRSLCRNSTVSGPPKFCKVIMCILYCCIAPSLMVRRN